jgi:phage gp29-like protein
MAASRILGPDGQPLKTETLTREVAAPTLTGIRSRWNGSVASGLTPERLAQLLRSAEEGDARDYLTLAEEMEERELHYASVLRTRKGAVSGLPVTVEPVDDSAQEQEIAAAVRDHLVGAPWFGDLVDDLMDALGKGYGVCELFWDTRARPWRPAPQWVQDAEGWYERPAYSWRDPRFFTHDRLTGHELRLLDDTHLDGVRLPPYKFVVHHPRLKSGVPIRAGLARLVALAYMCGTYTLMDWVAFAEVYGQPLRVGSYGPSASKEDIDTLITALANIGSDAAAAIPQSMKIEFQQAMKSAGGPDMYLKLAEFLHRLISKAVLGQTMTTDDGSSQAQARVHDEVRTDIQQADAKQLANTLNAQLVRPFVQLNWGHRGYYPTIKIDVPDEEDLAALVDAVDRLVEKGLEVGQGFIRGKLGIPDPEKGERLLQPAAPALPALNRALNRELPPPPDEMALLVAEQLADWEEQMTPVVDPVQQLADEVESFEDFLARLPGLADRMDISALVQRLAEGFFKARGRGDASDEP